MEADPVFQAEIGLLPPSVNKMYVYTTRGPRPSGEMKKFKAKASTQLAKQIDFNAKPLDQNTPYEVFLDFYLPALVNKGWPGKAKTKYKRKDVSNLVKVVEDLLSNCLGVDDSCFLKMTIEKHCDESFVGVKVRVYEY